MIKALGRVENLAPYADKLISNIQPNHQRADFSLTDTFDRLHHSEDDPSMHAMAVLAILRGQDLSSRADMTADDLQGLITALPDVVAFEAHANLLIEEVLVVNGQSKADQYALAANRLSQAVYGKQKEYWDQLRILHQEAKNTPSAPKSRWRFGRS